MTTDVDTRRGEFGPEPLCRGAEAVGIGVQEERGWQTFQVVPSGEGVRAVSREGSPT
ncbi:hypothetical protein [Streptomyces atroolivaceus]|uniref:Uncharacterized protein n=1 Tax=Streptomyces atroolivaceus TaxID=66869 RepID=A0ABV9VK50_STRAZ|nr:hypothetical protein [Streptomyces atroolivaceus]